MAVPAYMATNSRFFVFLVCFRSFFYPRKTASKIRRYLSTLSLSLFFFNLLVLPSLDGSQFFSTILAYLSEYHNHDDGIPLDIEAYGLPDNTLNSQMSRTRRFLRRWKGSIERGTRYLTIGLCSISLVGLLVS